MKGFGERDRQTDRQTDRRTDRQTETDRQTDRQRKRAERDTERESEGRCIQYKLLQTKSAYAIEHLFKVNNIKINFTLTSRN